MAQEDRGSEANRRATILNFNRQLELSYTLLPGRCPKIFSELNLHNSTYYFWSEFWARVFQDISGEPLPKEDFFRQDIVAVLRSREQIIGLHLYSFFHLNSAAALTLPYFTKNYDEKSLNTLRARGVQNVMSMEYLTVAKGYRQNEFGIPIAFVVGGLGYRVLEASGYDAMIAPCRIDLKVAERAKEFGAEEFSEPFTHHGVPVVNMVTRRENIRPHPDHAVEGVVDSLWKKKTDLSGFLKPVDLWKPAVQTA